MTSSDNEACALAKSTSHLISESTEIGEECKGKITGISTSVASRFCVSVLPSGTSDFSLLLEGNEEPPHVPCHLREMSSTTNYNVPIIRAEGQPYMSQQEFCKALETRQNEIRKAFKLIKDASKVDLCFLLDCTGSMQRWLDCLRNVIAKCTSQIRATYLDCDLRFAFVGYTDYDQSKKERIKLMDFTGSFRSFYEFIRGVKIASISVGGDTAEDVMGGLHAVVTKLTWRHGGTKILIHIADAPCHGRKYYDDSSIGDRYPKGDPARISHHDIMERLSQLNIQYWFGFIKKERTDKMISVLNDSLMRLSNRELMIQQFDASEPTKLQLAVYSSTVSSINRTADISQGKNALIRQFTLNSTCPDFTTLKSYHGTKTCSEVERLPDDNILLEPPSVPVSLKRAPSPFAVGGLRLAYHAYDETLKKQVVLKVFKRTGPTWNSAKRYMEVSEIQIIASSYAEKFNDEKHPEIPRIIFLNVNVLDLPEDQESRWYTMEEYIEGTYKKFNSNTGWVSYQEDPISATMQAFSHYTWVKSEKRLVICDLQGVETDKGIFLTDPAIHSKEYWRYGRTNMGPKGIRQFFKTHVCNDICEGMKLQEYMVPYSPRNSISIKHSNIDYA